MKKLEYDPEIADIGQHIVGPQSGKKGIAGCGEAVEGDDMPTGTPHAHYSGPEEGPFKCSHCVHAMDAQWCNQPDVIMDLGGDGPEGRALIHPDGCCSFHRPRGD